MFSNANSPSRRSWRRKASIALSLIAAAGVGAVLLNNKPSPASTEAAEPVVTVATPLIREMNQWDDFIGRFAPSATVGVRARVSGPVIAIHFADGDMVAKGALLFSIDPRPFAAALDEARAGVADATSALALAQSNFVRASKLAPSGSIPLKDFEASQARFGAAQAALDAAEARVRARSLDLEFTEVRAPIAGRISDRRIDVGNMAVGGDGAGATLLTTINALDPIYFVFDMSEALYLKNQRTKTAGNASVEVRLQDEVDYGWKGRLDFIDNGIDTRSGTIRGRATIANPDLLLTAGMFGNMRLVYGAPKQAILVPSTAVASDQAGKIVLTVGDDNVVVAKPVVLGPEIAGLRVVASGLRATDRVVIGSMISAAPGAKVLPNAGAITPEPGAMNIAGAPLAPVTAQDALTAN